MESPPLKFGSDVIVDAIKSLGFEFVALNPGASFRGIHDSLVNYGRNKNPEMILCCHEEIAVAMAAGYFRASGKPMLVLLHDVEGLLHSTRAVLDAWLERDAVFMMGGNGPLDVEKRRPYIDWIHTSLIPNLAVREFVKWDDQPEGIVSTLESMIRAYRFVLTDPKGPVYLSIDAGLQESNVSEDFQVPNPRKFAPVTFGEGSVDTLGKISKMLVEADSPVIIVDQYGTGDDSVHDLAELAESTGSAVIDTGARFNFPSLHPLNLSFQSEKVLESADVVLALGVKDLNSALARRGDHFSRRYQSAQASGCKVVRIDLENVRASSWINDYGRLAPIDIDLNAHAPIAVKKLKELCEKSLGHDSRSSSKIKDRKMKYQEASERSRKQWESEAHAASKEDVVTLSSLALLCWNLVKDHDWLLASPGYHSQGINAWIRRIWNIERAYQYPGIGGATGTGIGRAMGVALANKAKLCIDFQPDGDLLYAPSSLWTASHNHIPLLIVMLNNHSYLNDEEHQKAIALHRHRPVENKVVGIRIEDPIVDFATLAKSYGIVGTGPSNKLDSIEEMLREGIETVTKKRQPCLIDVLLEPTYE